MPDDSAEATRLMMQGALQQMVRDLEGMHKKAKDVSSEGGGLHQFNSSIVALTRNLAGPVGLTVAISSVAKSMEAFAVSRLQLRNFSTDVGASVPLINAMTHAMERAGIATTTQQQSIGTLGALMKDLSARGMGSDLAEIMSKMDNTAAGVRKVQELINTSRTNMDKAFQDAITILNTGDARTRAYAAARVSIAESVLKALQRTQEEMNKIYMADAVAAEKWHQAWVSISTGISNAHARIIDSFTKFFTSIPTEKLDALMKKIEPGTPLDPNSIFGRLLPGNTASENALPPGAGRSSNYPLSDKLNRWLGSGGASFSDRFGNWPSGEQQGTSGATDFGGMRRRAPEELLDIERDSNKVLLDMRNILQRMENPEGGGVSGEAGHTGYSTGQARRSLSDRLGINTSGGGGSTRGDRNNNPGNMKFGPLSQSFGATQADDKGFAVFPNAESGAAAQDALIRSDRYKGLTLDQFGNRYSEGSASWKKTVGSALGIGPNDIVNNDDPRLSAAIRKAEGTGGGSGGSGVPSSILTEARSVARLGGAGAVQQYIRSKGYHVDSAWCGDFAAAVVRGAGGTPPKGYPVASNWRNWGRPVEGDPQAGDIAIRRAGRGGYVRTGSTGSHVNIVDAYDPESRMFRAIGGNQSRTVADFSRSAFDFRRGEDLTQAREQIDKTQSASQRVDANMNATVDFKNMPSWVKSSVESNGKFKNLRVDRSTPQAGKASSPQGELQNWSYE